MNRLLVAFMLLVCATDLTNAACEEKTARVVARASILANPLTFSELKSFVAQNKSYFVQDGPAIRCMKVIGRKLIGAGLESYDPNSLERAYRLGPPEMAGDVARELDKHSGQMTVMGTEFLWLAEVLPEAAKGNWFPYINQPTPHGRLAREAMEATQFMMEMGDPAVRQMYNTTMRQFMPLGEQQVYELAIRLGE